MNVEHTHSKGNTRYINVRGTKHELLSAPAFKLNKSERLWSSARAYRVVERNGRTFWNAVGLAKVNASGDLVVEFFDARSLDGNNGETVSIMVPVLH